MAGKLQEVTDPTGTYGFAYDNMGRLIGTTTQYSYLPGRTYTDTYSYDAASNRTGWTGPDGSTNTYQFDTLNRLTDLTNSWAGHFGFGYDGLSRRGQMTRPNWVNTNYNYDSVSRLLSVLHQTGGTTVDGAGYVLDNAVNRTSKQNMLTSVTEDYAYDLVYQLTQVQQGGITTETYSFDNVGNRLSSLGRSPYAYNSSNQLTSTPDTTFAYDYNGNTTSKTNTEGTTTYTWDYENRLTSVTLPGTGGVINFRYDQFGRRIQKTSAAGTVNYVYDGANIAAETEAAGNLTASYAQGAGIDEPLALLRGGVISYYQADGLGSVTSLTNGAGALAATYTYDAFGNLVNSAGNIVNPFRYTGREWDSETGLYYYRARYYDSGTGRFLSEDPIRFRGGVDFYTYALNAPTNFKDPSGTQALAPAPVPVPIPLPYLGPIALLGFDIYLFVHDVRLAYQLCVAYGWCNPGPTRMPDQDSPDWEEARDECHKKCWEEVQRRSCDRFSEYRKCMRYCMQKHPKGPFSY